MDLITEVTIFVLAAFVGFEVISKVPTTLHTPLMSQTNAIHGIIMLGGLIVIGTADGTLDKVIGTIAMAFGTINIVGGFMVTDRMLGSPRGSGPKPDASSASPPGATGSDQGSKSVARADRMGVPIAAFSPIRLRDGLLHRRVLVVHLRRAPGTHPTTARRGNLIAAAGMAIAIAITLSLDVIGNGVLISGRGPDRDAGGGGRLAAGADDPDAADGRPLLRRGGGAAALIAWAEFRHQLALGGDISLDMLIPILFSAVIGSVSFWDSNIAFAKLQELISGRPISFPGQHIVNALLLAAILAGFVVLSANHARSLAGVFIAVLIAAAILGNLFVLPIGGADMPVVISLLNAFTGLAARPRIRARQRRPDRRRHPGRLLGNHPHDRDVAGHEPLDRHLLFSGFGAVTTGAAAPGEERPVTSIGAQDAAIKLAYADSVVFVPGYGMAVAQAQHAVKELANELEKRGVRVAYAIHPWPAGCRAT